MATLAIFVNAVGLILFFRLRSSRLLTALFDPVHPDWYEMGRAFAGYVLYAVSLLALSAIAILLVARAIVRRRRRRPADTGARRSVAPSVLLAAALTAAVVLAFIEVLIFQDYGIHFYDFDVFGILANAALRRDLGIQPAEVARVTVAAAGLLGAELLLCWLAARAAVWRDGALARASAAAMVVTLPGGLLIFHGAERGIGAARAEFVGALPLGRSLLLRAGTGPHIAVTPRLGEGGYPLLDSTGAPQLARRSNIVFFVPDGLRADMVSAELTPNLWRFSARDDVIHSARHYSSGHVSEAGIFGLLYGLNGHAFNSFIEARVPAFPIEVLKRNGYHTYFLSSSRLNPYPSDQLIRTFDEVSYPRNDDEALEHLRRYLEARRADGRPYFVLAFFYTPHFPFTSAKPQFQRYPMVGPKARTNYMNDVLQADDYLSQTFELVRDDFDAGRTVFLVTSDHGEEIREHGVFGHASPTFWNEKIQVPFALGLPGASLTAAARRPAASAHVDVWPTLFDYLGAQPRLEAEQYSDGRSLLAADAITAPAFVAGRFFPDVDRPSALVDGERKYWFRVSGVDPGGQLCVELTRVTDLADVPVPEEPESLDLSRIPAFDRLQQSFWRFLESSGPQTANCARKP